METRPKPSVSTGRALLPAAVIGGVLGAAVYLLFSLVGKSILIGVLAGVCCLVGGFAASFALLYLKQVEKWYRAHPEAVPKDTEETPGEPTEEA